MKSTLITIGYSNTSGLGYTFTKVKVPNGDLADLLPQMGADKAAEWDSFFDKTRGDYSNRGPIKPTTYVLLNYDSTKMEDFIDKFRA